MMGQQKQPPLTRDEIDAELVAVRAGVGNRREFDDVGGWCGAYVLEPDRSLTPVSFNELLARYAAAAKRFGNHDHLEVRSLAGLWARVAETRVNHARVSTVFLGLDHAHTPSSRPVVFETVVFGGPLDGEEDRYCTWDEAEAGHAATVARVERASRRVWLRLKMELKRRLSCYRFRRMVRRSNQETPG